MTREEMDRIDASADTSELSDAVWALYQEAGRQENMTDNEVHSFLLTHVYPVLCGVKS